MTLTPQQLGVVAQLVHDAVTKNPIPPLDLSDEAVLSDSVHEPEAWELHLISEIKKDSRTAAL